MADEGFRPALAPPRRRLALAGASSAEPAVSVVKDGDAAGLHDELGAPFETRRGLEQPEIRAAMPVSPDGTQTLTSAFKGVAKRCSAAGAPTPPARRPRSVLQALVGGWSCPPGDIREPTDARIAPSPNRRAIVVGVAGWVAASTARAQSPGPLNRKVFDAVWRRVDREYYDPSFRGVDWSAARTTFGPRAEAAADERELYRVINEMLGLLKDRHVSATTPTQVREVAARRKRGVATAAGFSVRFVEGRTVVTDVDAGSPADETGVRPGWLLVRVNGETFGQDTPRPTLPFDAVFLDATDREVSVRLKAMPYAFVPDRVARRLDDVLYVRFDGFRDPEIDWALGELRRAVAKAVVIDFRENAGGVLWQLERFAGFFFDRRVTVGEFRTRQAKPIPISFAGRGEHLGPLAVLVDGGSNSAAELFAAVVQDQRRGMVVGQKTPGSVLGAFTTRLPDGGELTLSERDIVLVSGRRLEGEGVAPDVLAPRTLADFRSGSDPGLLAALQAVRRA